MLPNAHLLGLFHRLCKLLFYRIKPIFVFDGGIPALKRQTMVGQKVFFRLYFSNINISYTLQRKRAQSKNKLLNEADRLQALILNTLAKEKVVQQALGGSATDILAKSPIKPVREDKSEKDDMFKLPPMNEDHLMAGPSTETAISPTKLTLHSIDVDSSNFKTLPADIRHEILSDIKETRKQSSWGRLHELPAKADNFSTFQMQRLLKRRKVQMCLEDAQKELGGQSLSVRDLEMLLTEDGVVAAAETKSKRIDSDDKTRFLMVSSIKKAMEGALQTEQKQKPELGPEFDEDLKKAVKMSLNEDGDEGDDNLNEDGDIHLTSKQKNNLTEAAKEMARAYMMEYAGMSIEDVQAILEGVGEDNVDDLNDTVMDLIEKNELSLAMAESLKDNMDKEKKDSVGVESSDDSDLEEVDKEDTREVSEKNQKVLEIVIKPSDSIEVPEDDLFADIFGSSSKENVTENDDLVTVVEEIEDSSEDELESVVDSVYQGSIGRTKVDLSVDLSDESNVDSTSNKNVVELSDSSDSEGKEDKPKELETIEIINSQKKETTVAENKIISPVDPKKILENLEKQKAAIITLTLDDMEMKDESPVIEIPDSPERGEETPSKKRTLTDYYDVTPIKTPKITPNRDEKDVREQVPYVKSPFFVRKTPRKSTSSEKKTFEVPKLSLNNIKAGDRATKVLFAKDDVKEADAAPSIPIDNSTLIQEASELLRSQKSEAELKGLADDLRRQNVDLEQERNKQSRFGMSITERMSKECQDMLRLFGVPFIVAPMEAEAQCAWLNEADLTHGTITDDSDVWLFGGATVYKNFFDQKKHVMEFRRSAIEELFHVDRAKLIQLAMLVGSDYTTGITGIGAVTGMEILAQFPATKKDSVEEEPRQGEYRGILSGLTKFRDWWAQGKSLSGTPKNVLRNKLKNITIGEEFPSLAVAEAYLYPRVDDSRESFLWGIPDAETIREFTKKNFGWTRTRTDELLGPVMKKLEEKTVQKSIKNYFVTSPGGKVATAREGLKISERLQRAVKKLNENEKGVDVNIEDEKNKEKKEGNTLKDIKKKPLRKRKTETVDLNQPSCSKKSGSTIAPRIPETNHRIPQRDRTKLLEDERLKKAAAIFKGKKKD